MKGFKRLASRFLPKPVLRIVRNRRIYKCKIEAALFPQKAVWYCPCCGMKYKAFVEAGFLNTGKFNLSRYEHTKKDVLCPVCKSLPRHRILASWCEEHKEQLRSSSILYFAPEYSMALWMRRNGITYTTADLFKTADLKLDIQATGLPDESYDVIIANHVLEHVDDFRVALKEVRRILKPAGLFICSFPMDPKIEELLDEDPEVDTDKERIERFGQSDHKRVFGMRADELLAEAGFEVEIIKGEDFPEEILPVIGPADYDMNRLFCCRKDMNG